MKSIYYNGRQLASFNKKRKEELPESANRAIIAWLASESPRKKFNLKDGNRCALRIVVHFNKDGTVRAANECAPWLLSDIFPYLK